MAESAAKGERSGKYRHIYGDLPKRDQWYQELKNAHTSGESSYVTVNSHFFAVPKSAGGGPVYIIPLQSVGRIPVNQPLLSVQKGKVLDTEFHPFIPNMIATGSEDCSVAITSFPMQGLTDNVTKADVMIKGSNGHQKKVAFVKFNPSANSILATGSYDRTVKLWNIESAQCVNTFDGMTDNIYSLEWNYNGSQLACTGKDKQLRIFDPRMIEEAVSTQAFEGAKSSKVFWMPNLGWIGACGFSKTARRQLRFWDLRDLSTTIFSTDIDQVSSVNMPHYDNDSGLLYIFGKGDSSVSYSEIINDDKKWYPLGQFRDNEQQKGGGWLPKKACSVFKCEVQRFFKLTTSQTVKPVSFIVPRKVGADVFQEDIYPDCYAGKPALSGDEWIGGENCDPITMSMNPELNEDEEEMTAFVKKKTYAELEAENKALKERIAELEEQLGITATEESNNDAEEDSN